jgi:hypothetical protein
MVDPIGRFAPGTRIRFGSLDFICGQEGQGLEMLPISPLPNLIGGEKRLHAPTSDDFTDTTSNLDNINEALVGFHLLDQDASKPGEGQSTWPYGLEGIARSYRCQIKLMLGTQALTQVLALGPFSESSSDDKEESLVDSDESRISTTYAAFDGPEDLRRFLDNDNLLGGTDSDPNYSVDPSRECFMCDGDPAARDYEETPSVHTPINTIVAPVV